MCAQFSSGTERGRMPSGWQPFRSTHPSRGTVVSRKIELAAHPSSVSLVELNDCNYWHGTNLPGQRCRGLVSARFAKRGQPVGDNNRALQRAAGNICDPCSHQTSSTQRCDQTVLPLSPNPKRCRCASRFASPKTRLGRFCVLV